ncbi:DNA primase [Bacillus phage vB_BpsS-36]|uniref:DNA primase n=1 Tax=Bacillus phage vB_BpsS-36 TaxID=2419622 RepID=A0A3G3BWS7_9CAUD|nr:DNA primase [Bacillus phage vB_BpsS-36]
MKPIERIREAVEVKTLLGHYGAQRIKGSGNIRSTCPLHGGDNPSAFVFSETEKLWYCHTGCQEGGDVFDFVMKMDEVSFMTAVRKLAQMFNVVVDWENETIEEDTFRDEAKAFIERMMKKNNKKELPPFKIQGMSFSKVTEYRGYAPETIDFWKFRYCTEGELKDRIVIPLEDVQKRLVGITGRATKKDQREKFLHRPRNLHTGYFLTGLGRNLQHVQEAGGSVKIVEGLFDCARWWDNGFKNVCCPIGVFFTEEHILELYKAGVTTLEIGFDNDKAGRNGFRKAYKRARGKFEIYFLEYPDGKDADECNLEELTQVDSSKMTWYEFCDKYGEEMEK